MTFSHKQNLIDMLVWALIVLVPVTAILSLAVLLNLVSLARENQNLFKQRTDYTHCLAQLFIDSQDHKITSVDLDKCTINNQPTSLPTTSSSVNATTSTSTSTVPTDRNASTSSNSTPPNSASRPSGGMQQTSLTNILRDTSMSLRRFVGI